MDLNNDSSILTDLKKSFCEYDWFFDTGLDNFKRPVVYVHYMNINIINKIYEKFPKEMPLIHFALSLTYNKLKEVKSLETCLEDNLNDDLSYELSKELSDLKDICGSNILSDIFYEIHDGKNAITNLSTKFPDVRNSMEKLYEKYGFDIIYESLT